MVRDGGELKKLGTLILGLLFLVLVTGTGYAHYIDVYVNDTMMEGQNVTITGTVYDSTNTSLARANVTVNATFNETSLITNTSAAGAFNFSIQSPAVFGEYNISIATNETTKYLSMYVMNISTGTITFISKLPPYAAGDTFLINVTMYDPAGGYLANYTPVVEIYKSNGKKQSWTIANRTSTSVNSGIITYNITVPSGAYGNYAIFVDHGAAYSIIYVLSGYVVAVNTKTGDGTVRSDFAPDENVTVEAKIRTTSGTPTNGTNVTVIFKHPNGITYNYSMNAGATDGVYNYTYTNTSSTGSYEVTVRATVNGNSLESSTFFTTERLKAKVEQGKGFFIEWGDKSAFTAGGTVSLNVIVTNLTDDSVIPGALGGGTGVINCTENGTLVTSVKNVNGSSFSPTVTYDAGGVYFGNSVCRIQFTAPTQTGFYKIVVNTTEGTNLDVIATGYFSVQKYILKFTPVSSMGGDMEFMTMLYPGSNATFQVSAYDMNTNAEVAGINITNITVVKLKPMEFMSGSTDITGITIRNVTYGSEPTMTIALPENQTGPFQMEGQAVINETGGGSEVVAGSAFYIAKYIMGFLNAGSAGGDGGGGGGPGGPGGGMSACSGTTTFSGSVMDIKSNSAASGVSFNNILEAREELTGKEISECLNLTQNVSSSTGAVGVPVLFLNSTHGKPSYCDSLSGFYFMLINVTYQGKADSIPSGFMCKRLSFWPNPSSWRVSPDASVNITVSSVTRLEGGATVTNGEVSIVRAMNFNPMTGGKFLPLNGTINTSLSGGQATLTLSPSNFSQSKWPNGFVDITVKVCDTSNECDTSWSGFQVTPFDLWIAQVNGNSNIWGQTFGPSQDVIVTLQAATNVSRDSGNYSQLLNGSNTTTTGFTAKIGKPWEGKLDTVTVNGATLVNDNWDDVGDTVTWGTETWNVNLTIPASTKKGETMLTITVNNSNSDEAFTDVWFEIATYSVAIPTEEGMSMDYWYRTDSPADLSDLNAMGFNLTELENDNNILNQTQDICVKTGFITERYGNQQTSQTYENETKIMVIANNSGSHDLIVFNNSGTLSFVAARQSYNGIYVWSIEDCGWIKIINSTASGSEQWGGNYQINTTFYMPYIVTSATTSAAVANANVSINAIIKQMDSAGGGGGMGFEEKLVANTDYTSGTSLTDANGVAFVPVNIITKSGSFQLFWKLTIADTTDTATFSTGTQVVIRNFQAYGDRVRKLIDKHANVVIPLYKYNATTGSVWNYSVTANSIVYNGTWDESTGGYYGDLAATGELIYDGCQNDPTAKMHFIYNPITNKTVIDDDSDVNNTQDGKDSNNATEGYDCNNVVNDKTDINWSAEVESSINDTFSFSAGQNNVELGVSAIRQTDENTTKIAFFQYNPAGNQFKDPVSSDYENVTVKVCAESFDRPRLNYAGASVYIYAQQWGMGPTPTQTALHWFDPINGTLYTFGEKNATTGPHGCVALDITYPNGWPNGVAELKAKVSYNMSGTVRTEDSWVTEVFKSWW